MTPAYIKAKAEAEREAAAQVAPTVRERAVVVRVPARADPGVIDAEVVE
jgi:hypothetical protein